MKKKYQKLYITLDFLEIISLGYNKIWENKYEEAIKEFSQLSFLPLRKIDDPSKKVVEFKRLDDRVREFVLDVILTLAKLIMHVNYKISNDTNKFTDISNQA